MTLEEIKQRRKEEEFSYLKGREFYMSKIDALNDAIANLNVEIKQKELEIQMKRTEITHTISKMNIIKSTYQQKLISLAEKEKKALEQLKTIEND